MKIGIIKEGKVPPDERVVLTPAQCQELYSKALGIDIRVQASAIRSYADQEYESRGLAVASQLDPREIDVFIGVKEVPISELIPDAKCFFFSHTAKMQPYNKELLKAVMEKKVTLVDWEYLTLNGRRLIGFGRYAGIVGAYNGLRAYGLRSGGYSLKPAHECEDRKEVSRELKKVKLPACKILLTGRGRVANGAMEILDEVGIHKVESEAYLKQSFDEAVYAQITFRQYMKHKDKSAFDEREFFDAPEGFESDFMRFAEVTDMFVAGHYWDARSPFLFTRDDVKSPRFNIKVVADISCDIDGPVATTIRPSTIADPLYGYDPESESEAPYNAKNAITVMAVDNLPCELPKDASEDFGRAFIDYVLPHLLNDDAEGVIKRATIVERGEITDAFAHLRSWVKA